MAKFLKKTLNHTVKRRSWTKEDSRKPLVSSAEEHDHVADYTTQNCLHSTDQPETDPEKLAQKVLSILQDVLLGDLRSQELYEAAEQVKHWAKLNGVTPEGKEGNYPENWLRQYLKRVEMSVEKHFPTPPPEGLGDSQLETEEYLRNVRSLLCRKMIGLVHVLEDARLLSYLVDSYNCHLFVVLDLLIDRSSSVKEALLLVEWVKQTYLSHDLKGIPNVQDGFLRVSDPLLLSGWLEKSKQKVLTLIQDHLSTTLQKILQYNETHCDNNNEEDLIKVHVDVVQCLNAAVLWTKPTSHILMTAVQRVCCDELHSFVQRYVTAEKKCLEVQKPDETHLLHLFRVTGTCRHLRSYALTIVDSNNDKDSSTLLMLENMEAQVLVNIQKWLSGLAEDHLNKYFKEKDVHLHKLLDLIQKMFAPLSQQEQGEETKQHIVNAVYQSVTRAYLQCLMQRKCRQLERRWGDIDERMMKDAELFHSIFTKLGTSDDGQKRFLLKMSEILGCVDVDSLKLICAALYRDFPVESKKHLPALLKWKKGLSRLQQWEILDVSQEACQNEGHTTPRLKLWCCCLCCT